MGIVFHCDHCGKKIEAPNNAGGKWGRCPACHNRIYVPGIGADDELQLSPLDESEEERKRQLMDETHKLTQDILQEREAPDGPIRASEPISEIGQKELTKYIILYLRQMADGDLEEAQRDADLIASYGQKGIEILDRIALSEIPEPELADIPQQVLAGFIRNLRARIS